MHLRLSLFFLKSAPGGILSSTVKREVNLTRAIELLTLTMCTTVQTRQAVAVWANIEGPPCIDVYNVAGIYN